LGNVSEELRKIYENLKMLRKAGVEKHNFLTVDQTI